MVCPSCNRETPGIDHNQRGLRCEYCFARLQDVSKAEQDSPALNDPALPSPSPSKPGRKKKGV